MFARRSWRELFAAVLWPGWCLACGAGLRGEGALLLCPICHGKLRPFDLRRHCRRCLLPVPPSAAGRPTCLACRGASTALDSMQAVWSYELPLSQVLRAFKFGRLEFLAEPLIREAESRELFASLPAVDLVVPVPLSGWRRVARGFNQAESLARALARRLGVPVAPVLARRSPVSPRQARLRRRQRLRNLDGDLRARPRCQELVAGRSVLIVDDIVTTGSTLTAAAGTLRSAGARELCGFAVAATPRRAGVRPARSA